MLQGPVWLSSYCLSRYCLPCMFELQENTNMAPAASIEWHDTILPKTKTILQSQQQQQQQQK